MTSKMAISLIATIARTIIFVKSALYRTLKQRQSIAPIAQSFNGTFTVTHCFHPYYQRTFKIIEYYRRWGREKVTFYDDEGRLSFIPAHWTDLIPQEPFVLLSKGKAYFEIDGLMELSKFIQKIKLETVPNENENL